MSRTNEAYAGLELGPIRPPSEAQSLLVRVTRNCPWNRCSFCPVYKGTTFNRRPLDHVLRDIDTLRAIADQLLAVQADYGSIGPDVLRTIYADGGPHARRGVHQVYRFVAHGMESVFLQDANSLVVKPDTLVRILTHIKACFPEIRRITSYARSRTVAAISPEDLKRIADAGLNRMHLGMESGSDAVLANVRKGSDKAAHIRAGQRVKQAGMELSMYVMPGLGGKELSETHALETADALNQINPDFIRIRTLALPDGAPLTAEHAAGTFHKPDDLETARELLLLLRHLSGITSTVTSDHMLNLFSEIHGPIFTEKPRMIAILERFLALPREEQMLYQIGRRNLIMDRLDDLQAPDIRIQVAALCERWGVTPENTQDAVDTLMKQFI